VLDGISSWWTNLHGHAHPKIVEAIARQAATLDHVQFAGCTHGPAVETAERLSPEEHEPSLRLFQLTLGALRALSAGEHPAALVLDAYLLRAMSYAGWAPALRECAVCASPGPHRAFSVPAGGSVCSDCRPPGAANPAPSTLLLMAALTDGDWPGAEASPVPARREASGLVAAHLQWHLERALRSLPLVDRSST